ncbi:MAG: 4-carboxy-4-hydroxy-2-oxoadipate aldolase/oxaloacetate decarboxylase [Acidimicrobiia bacterium]|jgi:4-hydroxy-4-methyl-2-oxoglutarate aldolase
MSDSRHVVVRSIDRAGPATIAGLGEAGVATAHEAAGRIGLLDPGLRPIQDGSRVAGSAITVLCQAGDNMMIHAAVEVVGENDVLVVTTTAPSTDGMFGELLATSLRTRGCAGLVIDAGVRDVAALREMGFPVWARAIHAQGTVKETPGAVNVPITIRGTRITPGDVVIADDDGVMIVPRDSARTVLDACADRETREDDTRRRLATGELGLDMYGLREKLDGLGVRWVDGPDEA